MPTYPSTLTYNQTQISYTDPGVPCGSRSVAVTWKIPPDYSVPSDPNFIITVYSYGTVDGTSFADTFNSDVFRIVNPAPIVNTNTTSSETPEASSGGLPQSAIIGIAIGVILAVILIGLLSWILWRRKRNGSDKNLKNSNDDDKRDNFVRSLSRKLFRIQIPRLNESTPQEKRSSNCSSTEVLAGRSKDGLSTAGPTRNEAGGNELFELPGSPPPLLRSTTKPATPKVYYELGNGDEAWEMAGDMPLGWDQSPHHPQHQQQQHQPGTLTARRVSLSPALVSPMTEEEPGSPQAFHVAQCVNRQRSSARPPAIRRTSKARIVTVRRSMTFASVSEASGARSPGMASDSSGMRSPRHLV